ERLGGFVVLAAERERQPCSRSLMLMAWIMLGRSYTVRVKRDKTWEPGLGWAVNTETGELDATMGSRILGPGDRPAHSELARFGPDDWVAEGDPIPGLPVEYPKPLRDTGAPGS